MLVAIWQGLMAVISPSKNAVKMGSSVCSSRFCKNSMLVAFERCLKRCDGLDKLVLQSVGMRAGIFLNSAAGGSASGGVKVVHFDCAFLVGSDLHARFAGFIGFGCCRVATLGGDGYKGHKQEAGMEGDFLFHGFRLLWQICAADGFV